MGLPAFTLSESVAANDNDRGPTSTDPCRWHMFISACDKHNLHTVAAFARQKRMEGMGFDEFADKLTDAFKSLEEWRLAKARWCRVRAKKLAIKRRRQAAKRASKRRVA